MPCGLRQSAHYRDRPHRGSRRPANLQRKRHKQELRNTRPGELVEIQALDDVNSALDEQMNVIRLQRKLRQSEPESFTSGRERPHDAIA
jgi:hypothetical protein